MLEDGGLSKPVIGEGILQVTNHESSLLLILYGGSGGLLHLAGTQAAGADTNGTYTSLDPGANLVEIRQEPAARRIVGMADIIAGHGSLAAYITTSCHGESP